MHRREVVAARRDRNSMMRDRRLDQAGACAQIATPARSGGERFFGGELATRAPQRERNRLAGRSLLDGELLVRLAVEHAGERRALPTRQRRQRSQHTVEFLAHN